MCVYSSGSNGTFGIQSNMLRYIYLYMFRIENHDTCVFMVLVCMCLCRRGEYHTAVLAIINAAVAAPFECFPGDAPRGDSDGKVGKAAFLANVSVCRLASLICVLIRSFPFFQCRQLTETARCLFRKYHIHTHTNTSIHCLGNLCGMLIAPPVFNARCRRAPPLTA